MTKVTTIRLTDLVPDSSGPVEVTIDEGGMRCVWKTHAAYIPLVAIEDVSVDEKFFGGVKLVLDGHEDDDVLELEVSKTASPVAVQRVLLVGLEEQRRSAPVPEAVATRLERCGRPLDEWLLGVSREKDAGYRETPLDLHALETILDDPHGLVENRAAAAWALLTSDSEDHLRAAIRSIVDHAVPPLVLAVADIPTRPTLIPTDIKQEAHTFLSPADRSALSKLEAAIPELTPERKERLEEALARAKEAVMARIKQAEEEGRDGSKWRRLHHASSGTDTRWVGKTWAL